MAVAAATMTAGEDRREQVRAELEPVPLDAVGPERVLHYYEPSCGLRAVVVIDTTRYGMSAGGVRMAADLTLREMVRLARAMSYKYALLELPCGGAKAGIWLDPAAPSRARVMAAFLEATRVLTESRAYIPGADMGTSAADFESLQGASGEAQRLGLQQFDGLPLEDQLTGYGVVVAARTASEFLGGGLHGARVAIEGFGKVGAGAAKFFAQEGARLVAVSTVRGALYDADGLAIEELLALRERYGDAALEHASRGSRLEREALLALPVDILVPGARPDAIHAGNVESIQARLIVPAANIPYAPGSVERLQARGIIAIPDFVSNAGGVLAGLVGLQGGTAGDAFRVVHDRIAANLRRVLEAGQRAEAAVYTTAVRMAYATLTVDR